jgi:hypothetical protein
MKLRLPILASAVAVALLASAVPAAAVPYELAKGSTFEYGCFAPCECPILLAGDVSGSFALDHLYDDPLYAHYAVTDVAWKIPLGDRTIRVSGSGEYRIGGEFALTHQLILDLKVDGNPPQHFDSGMKVGGIEFPDIDIAVAVHGFYCYDTSFTIRAVPATADVPNLPAAGIRAVRPNPFRDLTVVDFALAAPGRADLGVYDPQGRRVRVLVSGTLDAGPHRATWDGTADDGTKVPAGLYFLRLDAGGLSETARVVRVR